MPSAGSALHPCLFPPSRPAESQKVLYNIVYRHFSFFATIPESNACMWKKIEVDATLTFDPKGHLQGHQV